jgi:hypothetical protein
MMDDACMLSARRTPLGSSLRSYIVESPVPVPGAAYGAGTVTAPYSPRGPATGPPLSYR